MVIQGERQGSAAARFTREAVDKGRQVLILAADRPYKVVQSELAQGGIRAAQILDVITLSSGRAMAERPADVTFLHSPTMLEMMVMRIEQITHRMQNPHVVVDSLSALALYNGAGPVEEFSHYLTNRLRMQGITADLLVHGNPDGEKMQGRIRTFVDTTLTEGVA